MKPSPSLPSQMPQMPNLPNLLPQQNQGFKPFQVSYMVMVMVMVSIACSFQCLSRFGTKSFLSIAWKSKICVLIIFWFSR